MQCAGMVGFARQHAVQKLRRLLFTRIRLVRRRGLRRGQQRERIKRRGLVVRRVCRVHARHRTFVGVRTCKVIAVGRVEGTQRLDESALARTDF